MARLRALTPVERWQAKDDPIRALAEREEKKIKASFHLALKHLGLIVPVKEIAEKLKRGGKAGAVFDAIPFAHWKEVLKEPIGHLGDLHLQAAEHGAGEIRSRLRGRSLRYRPPGFRKDVAGSTDVGFNFDRFDPETQKRLHEILDGLITDLSDQAKATISSVVLDGVRAGDSFDDIAKNIRDTIALTPNQAQAVANYRRDLESLDSNALQRALRDTTLDADIQDAIDSGDFLSDEFMDKAVDAYLENYLDYRANTIARTESLRAGNTGLREGYTQAVDRGVMPAEAVTRFWQIAMDERVCPLCLSIVENNPNGVGLREDFQSDDGPVDDPPSGTHPACRCTISYETNIDLIPAEEDS
jgi:hypothetical protein